MKEYPNLRFEEGFHKSFTEIVTGKERYLELQPKVLTSYVEIRIARDRESDKGTKYQVILELRHKGKVMFIT